MTIRNLEHLFRPKSIAVIGASNTPQSMGQKVVRDQLTGGFDGPILPINPKWDTVASVLAYPDIGHLPLVPDLFYASVHQAPIYPGTRAARERGRCNNIKNVPLAPMAGSLAFRRQIGERILPSLAKFEPHFILISAGFDGHESDPLADLHLHEEDYAWVTMELWAIARHASRGRLVSTLEGGYDLRALGASAAAHVSALVNG